MTRYIKKCRDKCRDKNSIAVVILGNSDRGKTRRLPRMTRQVLAFRMCAGVCVCVAFRFIAVLAVPVRRLTSKCLCLLVFLSGFFESVCGSFLNYCGSADFIAVLVNGGVL